MPHAGDLLSIVAAVVVIVVFSGKLLVVTSALGRSLIAPTRVLNRVAREGLHAAANVFSPLF